MIDIGCNYIIDENNQNTYDKAYEYLAKNRYIQVIKFPGKFCNKQELVYALNFAKKMNIKIDLHGLPGMEPRTHSKRMLNNIKWDELPLDMMQFIYKNRISTHIGAEMEEDIETSENIFIENYKKIKEIFNKKYDINISFGGENQSGGYNIPLKEISPQTISKIWEMMDFGVFDISHAKLGSKDLNITYEEYLKNLTSKDKVKILHISGNVDETDKYKDRIDKHVLVNKKEIKDIIKTINEFPNLDLIDTELAFNTKYSFEKELIIEVITLNMMSRKMNEDEIYKIYDILSKKLKNDISNIEEIIC